MIRTREYCEGGYTNQNPRWTACMSVRPRTYIHQPTDWPSATGVFLRLSYAVLSMAFECMIKPCKAAHRLLLARPRIIPPTSYGVAINAESPKPFLLPLHITFHHFPRTGIFPIGCLLGWQQYEYYYDTVELPNPRPTQPKKKEVKMDIWATFSPQQIFFGGLGFCFI